MSHWTDIRQKARRERRRILSQMKLTAGEIPTAAALLERAAQETGLRFRGVPAGNPALEGGEAKLDAERQTIWYNRDVPPERYRFYQAHELAHFWLGTGGYGCLAEEIDAEAAEEPLPYGEDRASGYSPHEREEREANVFGREFLVPTDELRIWHEEGKLHSGAITQYVGVEEGMVLHQMSRALLACEILPEDEAAAHSRSGLDLDPSQEQAAQWAGGPLLLRAGPGTGKTRTLTARVAFLLDRGVRPEAVLALTFSNKAAEEMQIRIAGVRSMEASRLWIGTFHAFGLELLRKHGNRLGLPLTPKLVDPIDALFLLETLLAELDLNHYQHLPEPTRYLKDILRSISRAKDELISPAAYAALANEMLLSARDTGEEERIEAAEKALEVARVYRVYQEHLQRDGCLDFGDLIYRSFTLLREHDVVREEVRERYQHVLVDEYQDTNRASGMLLKEVVGEGSGLWIVADVRQSIYRWRGASPDNVRRFMSDFPQGEVLELKRNYRSTGPVVRLFSAFASGMEATKGKACEEWEVDREADPGEVRVEVAEDIATEAAGLATLIRSRDGAGTPLRDQAILCRSHTNLARFAALLEAEGVPVLYLGDVFERPEIRDLLSLVALTCEPNGFGLLRVAEFPEYRIPLQDVLALFTLARDRELKFPDALRLVGEMSGLSEQGRRGFALLSEHLDGIHFKASAWDVLTRYLFDRSGYLSTMPQSDPVRLRQQHLAIYQFLQLASEHRSREMGADASPRRAFLRYVRKLAVSGEDRQLRHVPDWADDIDAVRLLTVHASKGLEFGAVYLPAMATTYFPVGRKWDPCPPPEGMLPESTANGHLEEEECLFFVALSRARDSLCLSRALRYGSVNRKPSMFFDALASVLPDGSGSKATWPSAADRAVDLPQTVPAVPLEMPEARPPTFTVVELDVYRECAMRYYYEFVLKLNAGPEGSEYLQYHRAVRKVLRWMYGERASGRAVDETAAAAQLEAAWAEGGPTGHAYGDLYKQQAACIIRQALVQADDGGFVELQPDLEAALDRAIVTFRPDAIRTSSGDGAGPILIQQWKTGKPTSSEADRHKYALYHKKAREAYPDGYVLQAVHIATGTLVPLATTDKKMATRISDYNKAIEGILSGAFDPSPDDQVCPKCPYYHICPCGLA